MSDKTQWQFDILLADKFVLTELAGVIDVIRIANRISAKPPFRWILRSRNGGLVTSSAGVFVKAEAFTDRPDADYAFVIGNSDPQNPELSLGSVISKYTYRQIKVLLLAEAASRYINEHGGEDEAHTTHWENGTVLQERLEMGDANFALAVDDGRIVTCAGMGATVDVTLAIIKNHLSSATVMTVADILLHEHIRDFSTLQPFGGKTLSMTGDKDLDRCIELMQANMEEPLPISQLVQLLGVSSRSLERKFKASLGTTPNNYYRELRMNKANNLLLNTTLSVREVGLACGFVNGFSSLYKSFFGITPLGLRRQSGSQNE
ncbi:GlxA family transcriptional regulator [Cochlodiniinecator piscidefendens]|uniref:GlxA family transcriptional regulator n=1 Tax=Cochlodiniinecator piscidefendens TaxID=2715756 RepID=UPI00140BC71B|nr:helix-turn-helix domain-containing protein [Cochlodiniinecator piscidefendens]